MCDSLSGFQALSLTRSFSIIASFNPKAFHFCCLTNEGSYIAHLSAGYSFVGPYGGAPSVFLRLLYRAHKGLKYIPNHTQHTPAVSVTREAEARGLPGPGLDFEPTEASHDEFGEKTLAYRGRKSDPPHPWVSHTQIQPKADQKKKNLGKKNLQLS